MHMEILLPPFAQARELMGEWDKALVRRGWSRGFCDAAAGHPELIATPTARRLAGYPPDTITPPARMLAIYKKRV